jgi:predicted O-linked N-acetylglucosamine transferase (SPINDLY family)
MSADFGEHPVGQLLRSVPAMHDRARFKVVLYALNAIQGDS